MRLFWILLGFVLFAAVLALFDQLDPIPDAHFGNPSNSLAYLAFGVMGALAFYITTGIDETDRKKAQENEKGELRREVGGDR